jgi:hypothetical protein
VGKEYPPFSTTLTEELHREMGALFAGDVPDGASESTPSLIWPAVLTLHGTACLLTLWEDLGVSPLLPRLVFEQFRYDRTPQVGDALSGRLKVEDVGERFESERGVEEQVDILVEFKDSRGTAVASYRSSYRIPVALMSR